MRATVDAAKLQRLMREVGRRATGPGCIYLTGGASALLVGWRATTIDVDIKLDPEPAGVFEAIATLKNELDLNIELSAPDQFLPQPTDWREHSRFIVRHGDVEFFHYDFRAQALAKLSRGHERDLADVRAMMRMGLVEPSELKALFEDIEPQLIRYPSVDARALRTRVEQFLGNDA